jgi:predicted TIM-barrel fold metal-dependent hydrolase
VILDAHSHVHDSVDSHVALLDEAGVDRTIVFGTRPHPERATDVASLRRELSVLADTVSGRSTGGASYRLAWDEVDAAIAAFPDRFIGFGKVDLELPTEEIATVVETEFVRRGYRGIGELTPPPGQAGRVEPALAAAADHGGLPVVVHGHGPTVADLETLAALARRHPSVPLVVSQLGGLNWLPAIELAHDVPNLYLETSTANIIFAIRLAIAELPDRVLFGSDAPYGDPCLARATIERVTEPGQLRDRILGENLAELLRW